MERIIAQKFRDRQFLNKFALQITNKMLIGYLKQIDNIVYSRLISIVILDIWKWLLKKPLQIEQ